MRLASPMRTVILSPSVPRSSARTARSLAGKLHPFKHTVFFLTLVFPVLVLYAQQDDFLENNLEGGWTGSIEVEISGTVVQIPLQLNLNVHGEGGIGFALLPDALYSPPSKLRLFTVQALTTDGNDLEFQLNLKDAEFDPAARGLATLHFDLSYDANDDKLTGIAASSDQRLDNAVTLARISSNLAFQKIWFGTVTVTGEKTFVLLQLLQDPSSRTQAADTVTGSAIVGSNYGTISNGSINRKKLTADITVVSGSATGFELSLKVKGGKLKGKLNAIGSRPRAPVAKAKFVSNTLKGKTMKANEAVKPDKADRIGDALDNPVEVTAGEDNEVRILGKNIAGGVMVHADDPTVEITSVVHVSKKEILIGVRPEASSELRSDAEVSIRLSGEDGQSSGLNDALSVKEPNEPTVSFANDIQPVFNTNCISAGCHSSGTQSAGLDLTAAKSFGKLVNVPSTQMPSLKRVSPLDPANSYLIRKLEGTGIIGSRMPRNAAQLSTELIQMFITWIEEGATNN